MKTLIPFFLLVMLRVAAVSQTTNNNAVLINGVQWAHCNVDEPGTFAEKPEDAGKLYQWNRTVAYSAGKETIENWNNSRPEGEEWETVNNPCPSGWRVPTNEEIRSLFDTAKVSRKWIKIKGVNGLKLIDKENGNSIFLPAVGYRMTMYNGKLYEHNLYGHYWSSTQSDGMYAYGVHFSKTRVDYYYYDLYRADARTIRAVKE